MWAIYEEQIDRIHTAAAVDVGVRARHGRRRRVPVRVGVAGAVRVGVAVAVRVGAALPVGAGVAVAAEPQPWVAFTAVVSAYRLRGVVGPSPSEGGGVATTMRPCSPR